jgi:hypothetical protein
MYYVSEPCTYVEDGRVIMHRKAGAVVELSDELAAELGDKVRLVGGDPDAVVEASDDEREVPVGAPAIVDPIVDPDVAVVPDEAPDETPDAVDPVAARRSRRGSDG